MPMKQISTSTRSAQKITRSSPMRHFAAAVLLSLTSVSLSVVGCSCFGNNSNVVTPNAKDGNTNTQTGKSDKNDKNKADVVPVFQKQPDGKRVALLYTASVQGYVEPCGCTGDPLGGVARLSAALDLAHANYGDRVVFVDAGDLLFEKMDDNKPADLCQAQEKTELLLSTYARKGLAATVLGDLDDVRGPTFRDALLAKHQIPTLGIPDAGRALQNGALHRRSLIKDAGGTKIGLTAIRADTRTEKTLNPTQVQKIHDELAQEVAELVKQKVDSIVVLSQIPRAMLAKVTEGINGIDMIIQGKSPGESPVDVERLQGEKGPLVVAAGMQAQYLGVVELRLDGRVAGQPLAIDDRAEQVRRRRKVLETRINEYEKQLAEEQGERKAFIQGKRDAAAQELQGLSENNTPAPTTPHAVIRSIPLVRGFQEEKIAADALAAYEKKIPSLVASCEANIECPKPAPNAPVYVGVESCNDCHKAAVQFWQKQSVTVEGKDKDGNLVQRTLSHAKAFETLQKQGKERDRSCIGCHTVGFGEAGGFCKTADVDFRADVQCESCHGPASLHVEGGGDPAAVVRAKPDETTCRGCHHVPHIPSSESFVFNEKVKHIVGPGHGEKLWRTLGGANNSTGNPANNPNNSTTGGSK